MEATLDTAPEVAPPQPQPTTHAILVERKCACGGSAGLTGACGDCQQKRLTVQRYSRDREMFSALLAPLRHSLTPFPGGEQLAKANAWDRNVAGPSDRARETGWPAIHVGAESGYLRNRQPTAPADTNSRPQRGFAEDDVAPGLGDADSRAFESAGESSTGAKESYAPKIRTELIVEDDAREVPSGKLRKAEFLNQLQTQVCASADAELAVAGRSTESCPYIEQWFGYYHSRSAQQVERALRHFVPEAGAVLNAADYIPLVSSRIQRAVATWARTGEITGVPPEFSGQIPRTPPNGTSTNSAVDQTAEALLPKGREGAARTTDEPRQIRARLGSGSELDSNVRSRMESAFGHDFSSVRVHTDSHAAGLASSMNALAFTVGQHIAFGDGEYHPGNLVGDALLAHELAHVVQQGNEAGSPSSRGEALHYEALEQDADTSALSVLSNLWGQTKGTFNRLGSNSLPHLRSGLSLQRCGSRRPAPVINAITVENGAAAETFRVNSSAGASGLLHWVTVANPAGTNAIVRADPGFPASDSRAAGVSWTINGSPVASSGDPLHVEVNRTRGKKVVRATLGTSSQELTVWAVFADIAASGVPAVTAATTPSRFRADALVNFTASIFPREVINDADHPDLSGARTTPPPDNGTQICGSSLAGGADHKWDITRRTRQHVLNPAGIVPIPATDACLWSDIGYPADSAEGNDDTHAGDENNDPYAGGGNLTSRDSPSDFIQHAQGADGNTLEIRVHFQELARLELNRRWRPISTLLPWRFHIKTRKDPATHTWVDNGTDAALDNSGF